ncbi:DUF3188 domain-containing protein [Vagococcus humatus]|uniref:DUF3188 domain-containing protein n=1 Tax=Vagococcus humatus TaxID=1889241 RepID=A0A3S0A6M4_9ENTE|nr:DUF3188 domain-containing protein [Vagococcus humatus]RST90126.1 DUF3188 domain-containing protein [Vagococcus humatus]
MEKNGLFLCSVGSLVVLYSLNPNRPQYDLLSLTTGIFLIVVGWLLFSKRKKSK